MKNQLWWMQIIDNVINNNLAKKKLQINMIAIKLNMIKYCQFEYNSLNMCIKWCEENKIITEEFTTLRKLRNNAKKEAYIAKKQIPITKCI